MSDSKIDFIESAHSFPDFFIKQNGKKVEISILGIGKVTQTEKKDQNFQFGIGGVSVPSRA